jgi:spoIIIJ-associated protein
VEWVEASGKSLAEAKEVVLDLLGVAEDDAEFVVLSEPKAGLFGRMRGEARVQARVRPMAPPPKRGRRQRSDRARSGGSSRKTGSGGGGGNGGQRPGGQRNGNRSERSSGDVGTKASDEPGSVIAEEGSGEAGSGSNGSRSSGSGRSRRGRGSRSGGAQGAGRSSSQGNQNTGGKPAESEDSMEESLTLEQQGQAASDFVAGLVREFGLVADVGYTEVDEDTVQVAAVGNDLGMLVGPRGATLAAVQDLTRTFVQRQSENRTDRILVDVGGYREKRSAALRRFTAGIVEEVKSTGEERALEPMSPADRKVVHDTVNEIEGVETRSDGSEPARYVVIQPSS